MGSILTALHDGELFPSLQYVPKDEKYVKLQKEHLRLYQNILETLEQENPSLKAKFDKFMEEEVDIGAFERETLFLESFRLGARMMIEIYENDLHLE